jgi:hypothetical protein
MSTFTITLELPNSIKTSLGKDTGIWTEVQLNAIPANVLKAACLNGFISALNDISRGKDENDRPLSDEAWGKKRAQRVATWVKGEWTSSARSESAMSMLKDQFISEQVAGGATAKQAEASIKATVAAVFGDKEPATFARFLDAVATMLSKEKGAKGYDEVRAEIEGDLQARAEAAALERAKVVQKADVSSVILAAFKR